MAAKQISNQTMKSAGGYIDNTIFKIITTQERKESL